MKLVKETKSEIKYTITLNDAELKTIFVAVGCTSPKQRADLMERYGLSIDAGLFADCDVYEDLGELLRLPNFGRLKGSVRS